MLIQQTFKREARCVYTEEFNKIVLRSNDDKSYKRLTELQHIQMEQILLKYMKVRC